MNAALFWSVAGVLMVLVAVVLCFPLLRRRSVVAGATNRAVNASIYRDQLAELIRERDGGALSESDYRESHAEIERRLIEDTRSSTANAVAGDGDGRSLRTAVMLMVAIPLIAVPLYFTLGNPAALVPGSTQEVASHGSAGAMADLAPLAAKLAAKLETNPDNPQGWIMLGRTYKMLERYEEAEQAYLRAGTAANAEPALILERIELAADRNAGHIEGEALKMLTALLKKDPENPLAQYLAGYGAFNRQDYRTAITYWERLLKKVAPDSQDAANLSAGIAEARTRMSGGTSIRPPVAASAAVAPARAAADRAVIRGTVSLSSALKAKAAPGDLVFVFARAEQGPRMPLAVVRATVADLPLAFTLDDSSAMTPQLKLSSFKAVRVEARVAKSGDPVAKPGDLSGTLDAVKVGSSAVAITIDRILP